MDSFMDWTPTAPSSTIISRDAADSLFPIPGAFPLTPPSEARGLKRMRQYENTEEATTPVYKRICRTIASFFLLYRRPSVAQIDPLPRASSLETPRGSIISTSRQDSVVNARAIEAQTKKSVELGPEVALKITARPFGRRPLQMAPCHTTTPRTSEKTFTLRGRRKRPNLGATMLTEQPTIQQETPPPDDAQILFPQLLASDATTTDAPRISPQLVPEQRASIQSSFHRMLTPEYDDGQQAQEFSLLQSPPFPRATLSPPTSKFSTPGSSNDSPSRQLVACLQEVSDQDDTASEASSVDLSETWMTVKRRFDRLPEHYDNHQRRFLGQDTDSYQTLFKPPAVRRRPTLGPIVSKTASSVHSLGVSYSSDALPIEATSTLSTGVSRSKCPGPNRGEFSPCIEAQAQEPGQSQAQKKQEGDHHPLIAEIDKNESRQEAGEGEKWTPEKNITAMLLPITPDLAKLKIEEGIAEDDDTPKAGSFSTEKINRLTRAQARKLEAQKKWKEYALGTLSEDWDLKVRNAIQKGWGAYKPTDLARVVPQYARPGQDNWLNDEVINGYLDLICKHGKALDQKGAVPSYYAFNSFFYGKLQKEGFDGIARWSRRAKINGKALLEVEKIFIPINSGAHWTLGVVAPKDRKITHYNSMNSGFGKVACELIQTWVAGELGKEFKEEEWTLEIKGESPQQTNMDDCGVFAITSARQVMLGTDPMSYRASDIPTQRKRIVAEIINGALIKA